MADTVEIVTAYSATNQNVAAVAEAPGWNVVGTFFLPSSTPASLDIIASVSDDSLTLQARLFDLTDNVPISGSQVSTQSKTDAHAVSGQFNLTGQRSYQIQVQVTGGVGAALYGVLRSGQLA